MKTNHRLKPKLTRVMKREAKKVHKRKEMMRKFKRRLNQIELNISHTTILAGTEYIKASDNGATESSVADSKTKNRKVAINHTSTMPIPIIIARFRFLRRPMRSCRLFSSVWSSFKR